MALEFGKQFLGEFIKIKGLAAVGTQGIKILSLPTRCKVMEFLFLQRMAISIIIS